MVEMVEMVVMVEMVGVTLWSSGGGGGRGHGDGGGGGGGSRNCTEAKALGVETDGDPVMHPTVSG